ncbi:imidazole glycerol phosphate synthase subunit HisH [Bacillus sp. 179-C3.3 HS]|uniref:imidazole glycerol phosphate synthase subunit HisH n=1 Tax=Bacillus sp. 179-C3.3 HS TaxID=3232162 RepID=UPI0039A0C8E8
MIGVIDYGMGNLFSVSKALERAGASYLVSSDVNELKQADAYVLPGVGSFRDAMQLLKQTGLETFIHQIVQEGKLLFGICLGMQLLFEESEEAGMTKGLGLLKGRVVRLQDHDQNGQRVKVPHMGWNELTFHQPSPLFDGVSEGYAYFVHSYYVSDMEQEEKLASATYGVQVPAIVGKGNVFGAQFHPEKSSTTGMALLKQFIQLANEQRVNK